jgi:hypothetical protein
MFSKPNRILQTVAGLAMATAFYAGAQTPAPEASQAPAATPAPAAPAAAPTWSVGPMDVSGLIDGYYSYNFNTPSAANNGQANDLYNFNDKTNQFNLSEARLTFNHDPDPVGARIDFVYGRVNAFMNAAGANTTSSDQLNYIEQAFVSLKPPKAKGFELDFGKFVTSAGAEVIEAKDDWNYSRSILFGWAIPYWHFGARMSMPVSKSETLGVQVVNGWNNVSKTNGGATVGVTSAFVKSKASWFANYYGGPENANTTTGFRNLFDTTLLLTPSAKFSAYINYDYGQNRDAIVGTGESATGDTALNHWQGIAGAAHVTPAGPHSISGRFEYFKDPQGYSTGTVQHLYEFTGTYEYKWAEGLLSRIEYRRDWSDVNFFHKNDTDLVKDQNTITASFIAFFGPKR